MTRPTNRTAARRAVAAAALAALGWAALGAGGAAAATAVTEVGWWTRSPLASAPDGGFAVGSGPDGATSVAAVRIDLEGGVDTLVLEVQPTSGGVALGSLEVCVVADTWTAVAAGALDDAPQTACDADSVPFARAGDAWRADVSSLVSASSGVVSLGVLPTAGSGTVPFEVAFEAPAVRATGATPARPTAPAAPPAAPSPAPSPAVAPAPPRPTPRIAPAPAPAVVPARPAAPATPPASEPAPPVASDDGAGSTIELANAGILDDVGDVGAPRWGEAMILVLIGLGVGAGVYLVSRASASRGARGTSAAPAA